MQQATSPTRLRSCFPVPLTLRTLWAAATIDDPGTVEHAQTAIGLAALLGWVQRFASRTGQRPVGLEGEVLPREPIGFEGARRPKASHSPVQTPARLWPL